MVVKERIVVDTGFDNVAKCVEKVKEWLVSKGYKKITSKSPEKWSNSVILDIAKGGMFKKRSMQATFKSYMGGHSIMIEFIGSHDGSGLGGKPILSRAPDPKDKPYRNLVNDLNRFVKTTWKRVQGDAPGAIPTAPSAQSTGYQWDVQSPTPQASYAQAPSADTGYSGYAEPSYDQTGYDSGYGDQQPQGQMAYSQDVPGAYSTQDQNEITVTPGEPYADDPLKKEDISDDEVAALEAEFEAEEKAGTLAQDPSEAPTISDTASEALDEPEPLMEAEPVVGSDTQPVVEPEPEPLMEAEPKPVASPQAGSKSEQNVCPECGKGTKPKWRTCPYCEADLRGKTPTSEEKDEPIALVEDTHGEVTGTCQVCSSCGEAPTWVEEYNRYYCYKCEKYV